VVARFGLFLALISASSVPATGVHRSHWLSSALGITLVVLGAATILGALQNHRVYIRSLPAEDIPRLPIPWLAPVLAFAVAAIGAFLVVYLFIA